MWAYRWQPANCDMPDFERSSFLKRKMEKFASSAGKRKQENDGWFKYDYERFVDVSKRVMQGRSRPQQQQVVREVLLSMLPPGAPAQVSLF
ncbi:protein trichome birefringence-like 15 [Beta vulgaris subsp. vulgaris]|uniref:protein trichome birefringence-like 15 n=1 Tax=Beta vulgaris subsp. vulgaris TaxID=3555 RepID=UPI002548BAE6|nr:protein trichome birefringence-like 15 [Beta vulgaris subsp. vulgaris]